MIGPMLFGAFLLSIFGFDDILINAANELLNTDYSTNVYWLVAFLVGAIGDIIIFFRKKNDKGDVC